MSVGPLLHSGLEQAADRFGERDAVRADADAWSFRGLDALSNAFARHLAVRGVTARDRVAVMTSNRPEFVVAVSAVSKAGAAAVLVSPAWKALEVEHAISLTRPVHAIADGPGASLLAGVMGADGVTDLVAQSLSTYKHLRHIVAVDMIPRLPSGKVLRRTLRDAWPLTAARRKET